MLKKISDEHGQTMYPTIDKGRIHGEFRIVGTNNIGVPTFIDNKKLKRPKPQ
jgi:hypothetical protein